MTLGGFFFLNEDDNSFGLSPQNDIELRARPERAGMITLGAGRVGVRVVEGQTLLAMGAGSMRHNCGPPRGLIGRRSSLALSRCLKRRSDENG